MSTSLSILELINKYSTFNENVNVCFSEDIHSLKLDSNCFIKEDQEVDEQLITDSSICIGLYIVSDILDNLVQQSPTYTAQEALEALVFYIKNDAFIVLD